MLSSLIVVSNSTARWHIFFVTKFHKERYQEKIAILKCSWFKLRTFAFPPFSLHRMTHWRQCTMYLENPIKVEQDTAISGTITLTPGKENTRWDQKLITVEPLYNEVIGTMKITFVISSFSLYQGKETKIYKSWDQQNYLVIRGFCYIRPRYNEVPLYHQHL